MPYSLLKYQNFTLPLCRRYPSCSGQLHQSRQSHGGRRDFLRTLDDPQLVFDCTAWDRLKYQFDCPFHLQRLPQPTTLHTLIRTPDRAFDPIAVKSPALIEHSQDCLPDAAMCFGNARAVGPIRETLILRLCSNGTLRFLERPPDPFCNETCKGSCVHLKARTIQSLQILCAVFNANHRPRISA
jgi:hypothetical protein